MKKYLNVRGKLLDCSSPLVMGILNVTPDSFFDGGRYADQESLIGRMEEMLREGAAIADIGAQSTRPGAKLISAEEEWSRLHKPLSLLRRKFPEAVISVDSFYSLVAERAISEGADLINDVSGGSMDEKMFETVARLQVPYILMHMQGTPQTMQENPRYGNVVTEVMDYFIERITRLTSLGVHDIILDPGFGFGKTLEHNFELLNKLSLLKMHGRPLMAGLSRKSIVNKVLGTSPENALNGTSVLHAVALRNGADILRVHDVKEAVEVIRLMERIDPFC